MNLKVDAIMIQIRSNIFETNSSSTHSVSFKFKKQLFPESKLEIKDDTVVIYGMDQSDYLIIHGESSKLNYIFTWMYLRDDGAQCYSSYSSEEDNDKKVEKEDLWWPAQEGLKTINTDFTGYQYKNILKAIQRKYPNVKKICFTYASNSYFDHQTGPYEDYPICDLDSVDDIYNFIFNDHLIVEIGHD